MKILRPPAVPLVVNDPYMSLWSMADRLTDDWSRHWTGKEQALCGLIMIDNRLYRFMGPMPKRMDAEIPAMTQTALQVLPSRTLYSFEAEGIRLELSFLSPLLPYNLELMSRPVSYLDMTLSATDGQTHEVKLYLDISSSLCVDNPAQQVVWGRHQLAQRELLWMGSKEQAVLAKSGDDLRIDWGYLYTTALQKDGVSSVLGTDMDLRRQFAASASLPLQDNTEMPRAVDNRPPSPVTAWCFDFPRLGSAHSSKQLLIAYDDQFSVEYFQRKLRPYWRRNGANAADLIELAASDYLAVKAESEAFDKELMQDLRLAGGEAYAKLAALAFRQCIAAHKLVADHDGTLLFFSKENFSNGCMGTVDVTYPSSPFFLLFNPDLLEAQVIPILDYASSERWKFPFAPHDLGRYPLANGQVYGGGETSEVDQMPVEECGNMLLLVAALCQARATTSYAERYWPLLSQWAEYLLDKGLDPEHQLCTDDFAGHLAHNVNLSLKALLGIAAYAKLCEHKGEVEKSAKIRAEVEAMAQAWQRNADDGDHYRLAFDKPESWSQKYNLVWDKLLGLKLFPDSLAEKELAYYKTQQTAYGLPLDNRSSYTKLDWIVWSACLSSSKDDFEQFINPIYHWLNESKSRVPLTDWYATDTGLQCGFQARSVVGGVFIKLLYHEQVWKKWQAKAG